MKTLELYNDFHNTSATVRVTPEEAQGPWGEPQWEFALSKSQSARAERKLCGMECACGGLYRAVDVIAENLNGDLLCRVARKEETA